MRNWLIRTYIEGDESKIYELWQFIHPSDQQKWEEWKKFWHWKYRENPAAEVLTRVVEVDDQILTHHALVPIKIKIDDETILGSYGADAMTHPDYRRQGLFEATSRELWAEGAKRGIKISFGIPNKNSRPGMINIVGYSEVCPMTMMVKPVNWQRTFEFKIKVRLIPRVFAFIARVFFDVVLFRTHKAPVIGGLYMNEIKTFDQRFDRLWSRISEQYHIMTERTQDYLNWRFNAPGAEYKIFAAEQAGEVRGYLVLSDRMIRGTKMSIIFDLIADSEEIMHCLISEVLNFCKKSGIAFITYSFVAGRLYHHVLKGNGFIRIPSIIRSESVEGRIFCAFSNSPEISKDFLNDPENWLFQYADTDTI